MGLTQWLNDFSRNNQTAMRQPSILLCCLALSRAFLQPLFNFGNRLYYSKIMAAYPLQPCVVFKFRVKNKTIN